MNNLGMTSRHSRSCKGRASRQASYEVIRAQEPSNYHSRTPRLPLRVAIFCLPLCAALLSKCSGGSKTSKKSAVTAEQLACWVTRSCHLRRAPIPFQRCTMAFSDNVITEIHLNVNQHLTVEILLHIGSTVAPVTVMAPTGCILLKL